MSRPSATRSFGAVLGLGALMCLPCLGIALLTSGALAAVGGFLGHPVVILPAVVLVVACLVMVLRLPSVSGGVECCPPPTQPPADRGSRHEAAR